MKEGFAVKLVSAASFALTLSLALGFATSTSRLEKIRPPTQKDDMTVALPRFMQVILAGGDRFLATNFTVFRALVVGSDLKNTDRLPIQAKLQSDAAWFNPRHVDNYYLAAATLPWNGYIDEAQYILAAATRTRPYDMLPPFFYAFNQYYFRHDPIDGAAWLKIAALNASSEKQRIGLQRTAANWMLKEQDRQHALVLLEAMASQARHGALKKHILLRTEQLKHLIQLDKAIKTYEKRQGHRPDSLKDLVEANILKALPADPLGQGYMIDRQGRAQPMKPKIK